MKDEGRQAEGRKMERERRPPTLLEEHKETDEEIHQADEVDIDDSGRPFMNCAEMIEVGPVSPHSRRIGRALHQVMKLASNLCLIEIDLHVSRSGDLFRPALTIEADAD